MRTRVQSLVVAFGAAVVLGVGSSFATVGVGLTPLGDLSGGSVFSAALGNSSDTSTDSASDVSRRRSVAASDRTPVSSAQQS